MFGGACTCHELLTGNRRPLSPKVSNLGTSASLLVPTLYGMTRDELLFLCMWQPITAEDNHVGLRKLRCEGPGLSRFLLNHSTQPTLCSVSQRGSQGRLGTNRSQSISCGWSGMSPARSSPPRISTSLPAPCPARKARQPVCMRGPVTASPLVSAPLRLSEGGHAYSSQKASVLGYAM